MTSAQDVYMDATFSMRAAIASYIIYFEDELENDGFEWAMRQLEARLSRGKVWLSDDLFNAIEMRTAILKEVLKVEG